MKRSSIACCMFSVAMLVTSSRAAFADGHREEEAASHFRRGVELYEEADFRTALAEFRRAYEIAPNYRVLYNIAQADYQLNNYASALGAFRDYLTRGGALVPSARRAEVEAEIERLRGRVATVAVTSNTVGADILVDDVKAGATPAQLTVTAGQRRIVVTKDGRVSPVRVLEIAGGDVTAVTLDLPEERRAARAAVVAPPPPPPAAPASAAAPIAAWTVAGALTAGAATTGFLALRASSSYKDTLARATTRDEVDSAASRTRAFGLATDIVGVAALAAAGVAVYLTIRHGASASAALGPSVGTLGAKGSF